MRNLHASRRLGRNSPVFAGVLWQKVPIDSKKSHKTVYRGAFRQLAVYRENPHGAWHTRDVGHMGRKTRGKWDTGRTTPETCFVAPLRRRAGHLLFFSASERPGRLAGKRLATSRQTSLAKSALAPLLLLPPLPSPRYWDDTAMPLAYQDSGAHMRCWLLFTLVPEQLGKMCRLSPKETPPAES